MKALNRFWFTPPYQEAGKPEVAFELLPLDQRTHYEVTADLRITRNRVTGIGFEGARAAFEYAVVGWSGLEQEFSQQAKAAILNNGSADPRFTAWLGQIAGELYRRTALGEPEIKNS